MIKAIVERPTGGRLEQAAQSLFEQVSDAVLIADAGGVICSANPAAASMFAMSPDDLVGCAMATLVPDWDMHAGRGEVPYREPAFARRSDGVTLPVQISLRVLHAGSGRHLLAIFKDVSELKHLESRVQMAQKMEAVGLLAGGVAHDLNNLLTIVAGSCDTLRTRDGWPDAERSRLDSIAVAADQAASLTGQLLALSRPTVAGADVIDLHAALLQTGRLLDRTIGKDISIEMPLASTLVFVRMSRSDVGQILINLAFNARDAMPDGGIFRVSTRTRTLGTERPHGRQLPPGDYVELTVSDTGTGMAAETRARAFEPFFTTKPSERGTGLGLATVARIVQQCGGEIQLETAPGRGTTFSIFLPIQQPDRAVPVDVEEPQAAPRGSEAALVVEDDPEVRDIVGTMLRDLGYDVVEAAGSADALSAVRASARRIQLLVADVMMPGATGPELAERLRHEVPGLKVLFMSGYNEDGTAENVERAEAAFIRKPFTRLALARRVREVLDTGRAAASAN